ncbi:MAG: NADH:ubiquinone reductase (Na(+)-transporting) subunit C [Roseitalea sp.]|jgi:Na+-transporting NADH:ubiquinone oxidoreductase subunit C|nr:NADH:ubiquinone reductase (Na(+)-transporting) subunit C [Roseitalea sp.]MBO6722207.1 NADH:ubiquinone reductase (Na(+)-transporting) subunit C [Roseitalea sp.]MBO6745002.1 NADH:ubiquinone reductase (Na(+)-transporting) subunit C [Roseitalea sp.]
MDRSSNPVRAFLDRPNDDRVKVFGVAVIVAFVCAVVVSTASVMLKPLQDAHLEAERGARMEAMLDTLPGMRDLMEEVGVTALEMRMVDLQTGEFLSDIDPATYDPQAAAADPEQGVGIPADQDTARLRRRAPYAPVHLLERDGELLMIVLPVEGTGYQSVIRAMLALESDLNTIAALTILSQDETPGLGSRIEDPQWQAQWPGKQVADADGNIVIEVVRGSASGPHEIDGISGATLTAQGVAGMVTYWMGPHGYGPFLERLEREGI